MKIYNPGVSALSQLTIDAALAMGNRAVSGVSTLTFNDTTNQTTAAKPPTGSNPARALTTIYQNTSGRPLIVSVRAEFSGSGTTDNNGTITVNCDAAATPTTVLDSCAGKQYAAGGEQCTIPLHVLFVVPNNYYYRVVPSGTSTPTLRTWIEISC
jgi:hypothetical protein